MGLVTKRDPKLARASAIVTRLFLACWISFAIVVTASEWASTAWRDPAELVTLEQWLAEHVVAWIADGLRVPFGLATAALLVVAVALDLLAKELAPGLLSGDKGQLPLVFRAGTRRYSFIVGLLAFVLSTPALALTIGGLGSLVDFTGPILGLIVILSMTLTASLTVAWLGPPLLVIEARGLRVERRAGPFARRFQVRFDQLEALDADETGLELTARGGKPVRIPWGGLTPAERAGLLERIRERMVARPGDASRDALLDRGGRSLAEWQKTLAELVTPAQGYRDARLTVDEVAAVLADHVQPVERRMGAALALRIAKDPRAAALAAEAAEARGKRVRVALQRAVSDELDERALERAVEEDLAELEQARTGPARLLRRHPRRPFASRT